jgi:hypothetical protein
MTMVLVLVEGSKSGLPLLVAELLLSRRIRLANVIH